MRGAFVKALVELAAQDERIFLLTGDLGYWALEPFIDRFPNRFVNVGVAEQNMIGIATGMAEAGYLPFCYSIVTFACLRPYEFIRNGPIAHRLPVRIVGVGAGMEYAHNGITHYGLEDIAVMRTQPAITVVAPADSAQTACALQSTYNLPGPVYYRLGKDDRLTVPELNGRFALGRAEVVKEGKDLLVIATGAISALGYAMAESLAEQGMTCRVLVVSTLNPAPVADLLGHLRQFPNVMTIESHYQNGGLGSLVAEIIADHGLACTLLRNGVKVTPDGVTGSQKFMHERNRLDEQALVNSARSLAAGVIA